MLTLIMGGIILIVIFLSIVITAIERQEIIERQLKLEINMKELECQVLQEKINKEKEELKRVDEAEI